ncbi:MAG TPA: C13 family peptidase [Ramlibacter sp.]|nr:C13 family peptidase [Ramlibacter sp.]
MNNPLPRYLALMALVLLCGCAGSPYSENNKLRSDALLQQQVQAARRSVGADRAPRVIFAGFALHSQSKAFQSDVLLAEKAARIADSQAISFRLGNPAFGQDGGWPFATRENVETVLKEVGALARPQDKVVLLFASHGRPDALAVNAGNTDLGVITSRDLGQWMAALRGKPTLVVISACYSGSFIGPLRDPSRIIFTASARDRTSFGCEFHSDHTYFVQELLGQESIPGRSLAELMDRAREGVAKRESALKLSPSLPQSDIGATVDAWAREPLARWTTAP